MACGETVNLNVHAAVGLTCERVDGQATAVPVLGTGPRAGPCLDLGDNAVREGAMKVADRGRASPGGRRDGQGLV